MAGVFFFSFSCICFFFFQTFGPRSEDFVLFQERNKLNEKRWEGWFDKSGHKEYWTNTRPLMETKKDTKHKKK